MTAARQGTEVAAKGLVGEVMTMGQQTQVSGNRRRRVVNGLEGGIRTGCRCRLRRWTPVWQVEARMAAGMAMARQLVRRGLACRKAQQRQQLEGGCTHL